MRIKIEEVVETVVEALFSNEVLSPALYLKGGQALRLKEGIISRFSADVDFSTPHRIDPHDIFFDAMRKSLRDAFEKKQLHMFGFKFSQRPKIRHDGTPDFWSGWAVEFKLIDLTKKDLSSAELSRSAMVPLGTNSPKIAIDISEHEFCGSHEEFKLGDTQIKVYSRALLVLEKIRAICQQHPDYIYKSPDQRSRDYYDIERIWSKALSEDSHIKLIDECQKFISQVFKAKGVSMDLLDKIFESGFIELQKQGWSTVQATVDGSLQDFEYYVESLRTLIAEIKSKAS